MDALSHDGQSGITLIAFVGSVFSPYYARARRKGLSNPENYSALNVALYAPGAARWAMTERGRGQCRRTATTFEIGPSALRWSDGVLTIDVEEVCVPIPRHIRGRIRVIPDVMVDDEFALDGRQGHLWRPMYPSAHVELDMQVPELRWQGSGYLDTNAGEAPLEDAFVHWTWWRARLSEKTIVFYDVTESSGANGMFALEVDAAGCLSSIAPPPSANLPKTLWRLGRVARSSPGMTPRIVRTLEDTPFYARTSLITDWFGTSVVAMHESVSLERFRSPWVQAMLPFRMPRRTW